MSVSAPLTTYLELRESQADGSEGSGLSHSGAGLVLLHVLELAAHGEPRGGITLVHDAGDHGARYLDSARMLAQKRWAVALPDLRGHGRSEGARGHSAGRLEVLRDLQSVQDHLAYRLPDAPKVLIGQGLGAIQALYFALEKPAELGALVLLAPRWRPNFEFPRPPGGLMKLFKKPAPTDAGRIGNVPALLTGSDAQRHAWEGDALVHDVITLRAAQEAQQLAAECRARAAELRLPTLLLQGAADKLSDPADSAVFQGPNCTLRVEQGLAHDLLHERGSERIVEDICAWLEARLPAAR